MVYQTRYSIRIIQFSIHIPISLKFFHAIIMPTVEELKQTAFNAEKDLNSYQAKQGLGKKSDSSRFDI